jgi:hypothetical protein
MTANELKTKMLNHIEELRKAQADPDIPDKLVRIMFSKSVLRHLDGKDLLRVDQFVRSFRTE